MSITWLEEAAPFDETAWNHITMREYNLILTPLGKGQFKASLDGSLLVASTHEPLLAGARALLEQGAPPGAVITTQHAGSPHISMSSTLGYAATRTVVERKSGGIAFRPWKEFNAAAPADT